MSFSYSIPRLTLFEKLVLDIATDFVSAPAVGVGTWQSQDVSNRPEMVSYELLHTRVELPIPSTPLALATDVGPNLPWAEDHFRERVGGEPLNPPPSEQWWPYAQQGNAAHKTDQVFSHTYPERFWPKRAGEPEESWLITADENPIKVHFGIRYSYGDLNDVVVQLKKDLYTRQAYLPVWFPEDTGATQGQRVPCTLGYHFLYRQGKLHIEYHIRSCDFMRHWRDDVYMAGRLLQWVCDQVQEIQPGNLVMNIGSFHIFEGDKTSLGILIGTTRRSVEQAHYSRIASAL